MDFFEKLSRTYSTPYRVQQLIRSLDYNTEDQGPTIRSAHQAWLARKAHCLESSMLAAALLEHHGYEPLLMSLESQDLLDHVVFVFRERTGWGAISRSREEGLHGREPRFVGFRALAYSYFDPFVDHTGKLTAFGVTNLDDVRGDWRYGKNNLWSVEEHLIGLAHRKINGSLKRYKKALNLYKTTGESIGFQSFWW